MNQKHIPVLLRNKPITTFHPLYGIYVMRAPLRFLFLAACLSIGAGTAVAAQPLRTGVDATFPPHAFPKLSGGYQGFNVDLGNEIARRLGTTLEIEGAQYAALIPAMNAGKYDFVLAPSTVSEARAKTVLFTEGYLDNNFTLVVKKDRKDVTGLESLRGKTITVNRGSGPEEWARANQQKYGFEIGVYGTNADAVQAVISGRADANLAGITPSVWAAKTNPTITTVGEIKTGSVWAIPFRIDDVAGRNRVSNVIKCMKLDGSLKALHEKWFGYAPREGSATLVVAEGHGASGVNGYDSTPVKPVCK